MAVEREDEGEEEKGRPGRSAAMGRRSLTGVTDWRAGWLSVCDAGSEASKRSGRPLVAAPEEGSTVCLIAPEGGSKQREVGGRPWSSALVESGRLTPVKAGTASARAGRRGGPELDGPRLPNK